MSAETANGDAAAQQAQAGRQVRQAAAPAAPAYQQRGHKPSGHGKNNTVARCSNCLPRDTSPE